MMKCIALVLVAFVVHNTGSHPTGSEPTCFNRFDYDVKMVERMLVVEQKLRLFEEKAKEEFQKLTEEKHKLEDQVETMKRQLVEEQQKQTSNLDAKLLEISKLSSEHTIAQNTFFTDAKSSLEIKTSEMEQRAEYLKQTLTGEQNTTLEDLFERQQTMESRVNSSLMTFADKLQKPAVVFYMRDPHTTSPGPNTLLRFTTTLVNTNTVYSTSTGYFTAPIPGVYLFAVTICGYQSKYINFRIHVNDDYISDTTEYDADSGYHCTSTNAVAVLEAGDKVCVKTGPHTSTGVTTLYSTTYHWSTFMGTLIHG